MLDADRIAEQYQSLEGYKLADYRAVALPYYIIYLDAVLVERRSLSAVTEYLLRCISIGLTKEEDIRQFLGVRQRFFARVIAGLVEQSFISKQSDGGLDLLAKGKHALANCYESVPLEKEIPVAWDLLQRRPAGYLDSIIREADAKRDGLLLIRAKPMRAPLISEIPLHAVQSSWASRQRGVDMAPSEVIKLRQAKRRLLRYRPAIGLIYVPERGSEVRVRFAINGKIDELVSQGFAEQDGSRHMGIAVEFGKKASTLAIRTRLKELPGHMTAVNEYSDLLKKRAVARLAVQALERRKEEEEEAASELLKRIDEKTGELAAIDAQIRRLAFREVMPYEVVQIAAQAIEQAKKRIIITTRMPSRERLTPELLASIRRAAARGVSVSIYLAGKVPADAADQKRWSALRELDRLTGTGSAVEVGFLLELKRSIFEVAVDEAVLLVCNRPPLGDSGDTSIGFHPFSGILTTDQLAIRAYVAAHLSADELTVTQRLTRRIGPRKDRKPHPGRQGKRTEP
jgi:hypothetical protein